MPRKKGTLNKRKKPRLDLRGARYVDPNDEPLVVTRMTDELTAWHAKALHLRKLGYTLRQIAAEVGRSYGPVQRFFNPEFRRRMKIQQAASEKHKRQTDPEYAEKSRNYIRRYMQYRAPERWKKTDEEIEGGN